MAILDALVAGLPLITTDVPYHGPEIDYLEPGRTGLIVPSNAKDYADAVIDILRDPQRLDSMSAAAKEASRGYSIAHMVANFCGGIDRCLKRKAEAENV